MKISKQLETKLNDSGWLDHLIPFFESEDYDNIITYLSKRYKLGINIYPKVSDVFRAFTETKFDQIKVVIMGCGPYFTPGAANGLAFAVNQSSIRTPTLENIIRELEIDCAVSIPKDRKTLYGWSQQGVMLLNTILTVECGMPNSHQNIGWEKFTEFVLNVLVKNKKQIVFALWGDASNNVFNRLSITDRTKHSRIESSHPAPATASDGFFGSKPFSKINEYLRKYSLSEIDWTIIDERDLCRTVKLPIWTKKDEFYERRKYGKEFDEPTGRKDIMGRQSQ